MPGPPIIWTSLGTGSNLPINFAHQHWAWRAAINGGGLEGGSAKLHRHSWAGIAYLTPHCLHLGGFFGLEPIAFRHRAVERALA